MKGEEEATCTSCDSSDSRVKAEVKRAAKALRERLDSHDSNRKEVQEKLHNTCEEWRKQIDELEDKINSELEGKYKEEDNRLQTILNELLAATSNATEDKDKDKCDGKCEGKDKGKGKDESKTKELLQKAKAELLVVQKYELKEGNSKGVPSVFTGLELYTGKAVDTEWLEKPAVAKAQASETGKVFLECVSSQERAITGNGLKDAVTYKALLQKKDEENESNDSDNKKENSDEGRKEYTIGKEKEGECFFSFVPGFLEDETAYTVKMKAVAEGKESEWSEGVEFTTPKNILCCAWKECPGNDYENKYSVDEKNPRATKTSDRGYCTIIGNTPLPQNKVTSWSIKILNSKWNNGFRIFIGVAPSDIDQNKCDNDDKCGW